MNKKIWNAKGKQQSDEVVSFLAAEDIKLDKSIFIYDIDATSAHARGLSSIGIIKKSELAKIIKTLNNFEDTL